MAKAMPKVRAVYLSKDFSRIGGFMSLANMDDCRLLATVASQRDKAATPASIARGHLAMLENTEVIHETRS